MNIVSIYPCPYDIQDRHDPSATVISGEEIYAYEEDKLTSIKNDATVKFPERSMMMGLKHFNLLPSEIDIWVLPTPSQKPSIEAMKLFFSWHVKAFIGKSEEFVSWFEEHVRFVDHHQSHISLAVHSSDFDECLFVSQDGGGDFGDPRNLIYGEYKNSNYTFLGESDSLNSICSFHAFVTDAIGFSGGDNGKTSGLAAYGKVIPELFKKFRSTLTVGEEGIYFNRERYEITLPNLQKVKPQEYSRSKVFYQYPSSTNIFHMSCEFLPQDIAATGEYVLQTVFLEFLDKILHKTRMKRAVFSGGLFQNVSLNRRLIEHGKLSEVFIPMAPADCGLSLGAALFFTDQFLKQKKRSKKLTPFLGPRFSKKEIEELLEKFNLRYSIPKEPAKKIAKLVANGEIIGIFQGRGEYGPRSLGTRSIIGDPRTNISKTRINQLLKRRDWFMPFAPAICQEDAMDWVENFCDSKYMQIAFKVDQNKAELIPAAVHADLTSRVQVVDKKDNLFFWKIIRCFQDISGVPVILNTSFNRHGISTISSPRQAIEHLLEGTCDYLFIEGFLIKFSENRIAACTQKEEVFSERSLLRMDAVKRLEHMRHLADFKAQKKYLNNLCEFLECEINLDILYDNFDEEISKLYQLAKRF